MRHGAAADPAYVFDWMRRSCPPWASGPLRPLDSSPLQPTPPGEHAVCLNKEQRGQNRESIAKGKRWENRVDMTKMIKD